MCHLGGEERIRTIRAIVDDPEFTTLTAEYAIRQGTDKMRTNDHNTITEEAIDATLEWGRKVETNLSGSDHT